MSAKPGRRSGAFRGRPSLPLVSIWALAAAALAAGGAIAGPAAAVPSKPAPAASPPAASAPAASPAAIPAPEKIGIQGYDPVAYFADEQAELGSKAFEYEWHGVTWRFASAQHRAAFIAEPHKYQPQYGGYSAYAMSRGKIAPGDPKVWSVLDGKLYLNASEAAREKWLAAISDYIESGNINWPKLKAKRAE